MLHVDFRGTEQEFAQNPGHECVSFLQFLYQAGPVEGTVGAGRRCR